MPISDWSSDVCSSDLVLSFERPLEAQDGNAASGKDMDGHLVAGPAAKEALAIILHDNERMLVARPRVGRQDKVGEGLGSERSRVTEAAHLTELQPRKKIGRAHV